MIKPRLLYNGTGPGVSYGVNVMKTYASRAMEDSAQSHVPSEAPLGALHLVGAHEVEELALALARGFVPTDLDQKLNRLAAGTLLHRHVEQNCRLFIALLQSANEGSFKGATGTERERLLRVLAYVRKDDDAIPDYKPNGFTDDQREVRAAVTELALLLEAFKSWRLRCQVPGMWQKGEEVVSISQPPL